MLLEQYRKFLRMSPGEIEAWLRVPRRKRLPQRTLRWLVLDILFDRQDGRCGQCDQKLGGLIDMDVDHRTPKSRGGSDELTNLQLLCVGCHRRKSRSDV